jgi:hypothetical protein
MSFFNPIQKFYMADEVVGLKITADTAGAVTSVKSLRAQIQDATQDVVAMNEKFGSTSQEAATAAKKLAELKDQFNDAKSLADAFNPDRKFAAFSGAIQSVTGGFTALTGAMALFGVESEEVQKTLLKVQAALAISEGVNSILDGVQAFKNLGAVIQQSTVFLKANAVTTNIASGAMKLFGISVDTTSTSFKFLKTAIAATGIGLLIVALGAAYEAFQNFTTAAQKAADAQKEFNETTLKYANVGLKAELESLDRQYKIYQAKAKAQGASEEQLANAQKNYDRMKLETLQRYQKEVGDLDAEAGKAIKDQEAQIEIDSYNKQAAANQRKLQQQKEAAEKSKQQAAKSAQEKAQLEAEFEDITKQRRGLGGADITTQAQQAADLQAQKDEAQAAADKKDQERYQQQQDILGKIGGSALKKEIDDKRAAAEAKQRIDDAETQAKLENMQATANGLNALSDLIGQQTVAGKILAIASATINTYVGATKALAQGGFLGIAGAAAVIAAGLASVKKIIATNVPGRATGGSAGSAPSLNTQAPLSPQAPVVRTSTSLDANSINQIGQATTKTYVLESDVTNNQQRVSMLNRQARIG